DPDVDQVTLTDGEVLPADLVVMACGIRPRVDLAKAAGLPTNRAVLVNDRLATSVPGIFAVGECAEHRGKTYGLVAPIWEQTAVLADLLTATDTQRRYTGSKLHAKLKVAGVEVASMGRCNIVDDHDRAITVNEPDRNVSRKLIVRNGKLVGAQFVGETAAAAKCIRHFVDETPLPTDPLAVLVNPSCLAGGADPDPEICNCNKVNRSVILTAIGNGATDVEAVGQCTKAGTGCGSCRTAIAALLPQPAPVPT
ncbi:MAG: FAD-dependent oxidoreductase, partial [Planctomycetota bacterium]